VAAGEKTGNLPDPFFVATDCGYAASRSHFRVAFRDGRPKAARVEIREAGDNQLIWGTG